MFFGSTEISFEIRRSSRRRTVAVAFDPEDGVLVTAPENVPVERLDQVVRDKAPWILERLRLVEESGPALPAREFVSGETFLYLGRQYRLRVMASSAPSALKLKDGWLHVEVEDGLEGDLRADRTRERLVEWYRKRAAQRLPERVQLWAARMNIETFGDVHIADQRSRWASCDAAGNFRFNWRIVQSPLRLVDYVVVHELAHLVHRDHTEAFWRTVAEAQPDFEDRRRELRLLGGQLAW